MDTLKKKVYEPDRPVGHMLDFTGPGDKGLVQEDFDLMRFTKYPLAEGNYCQEVKKSFQERLFEKLDREYHLRQLGSKGNF